MLTVERCAPGTAASARATQKPPGDASLPASEPEATPPGCSLTAGSIGAGHAGPGATPAVTWDILVRSAEAPLGTCIAPTESGETSVASDAPTIATFITPGVTGVTSVAACVTLVATCITSIAFGITPESSRITPIVN